MLSEKSTLPGVIKRIQLFSSGGSWMGSIQDQEPAGGVLSSPVTAALATGAAGVATAAVLSRGNPINTALLTNQPIATPYGSTGIAAAASSGTWIVLGILVLGGLFIASSMRRG